MDKWMDGWMNGWMDGWGKGGRRNKWQVGGKRKDR